MKTILSAALVLGLCGLAGAGDEKADPVGTWKCEYQIGDQNRTATLTIKQEGEKLAGTMSWPDQKETKLKDVTINYPEGTLKPDKVVGDYRVYEGKTQIQATIIRAAGDTASVEVSVQFQACHKKGVCLLPAKVKLSVP